MRTGWWYRVASVLGVLGLSVVAVLLANTWILQTIFTTYVPLFWRLDPIVLSGGQLFMAVWLTALVVAACFVPLYKPRPRRILDAVSLAQKRVIFASCVLATLGYFKWSHRLPRATLVLTAGILFVALPIWFVLIRNRQNGTLDRAVLVGDDPSGMETILEAVDRPIIGYVAPPVEPFVELGESVSETVADGGQMQSVYGIEERATGSGIETLGWERLRELDYLGGFSRLDEVLVGNDVDTALLAFSRPDRAEFFGALDACYEHGISAKVHREQADNVLTDDIAGELVEIDLEPWDPQDHVIKRAFDVAFAVTGLVLLVPVVVAIAAAIKLDDGGSVLYKQERTATFGDTFTVYKFRSMVEGAESKTGATISAEDNGGTDPRVTRIGRLLRQTHLDEIPQLWSVIIGQMSVVGPRPERPELETNMESDAMEWRRRWFVKPGLTGLAQIHGVTGHDPEEKLRLDIEYIRRQSLGFDLKIVARQLWKVLSDAIEPVRNPTGR